MSIGLGLEQVEARRAFVESVNENSARLCRVGLRFQTRGAGEFITPDPVLLGVSFVDEPIFTHGYRYLSQPIAGHLPQATAFVTGWRMSADDRLFEGAFLGFVVDDAAGQNIPHEVVHHLHFEGVALKVPREYLVEAV